MKGRRDQPIDADDRCEREGPIGDRDDQDALGQSDELGRGLGPGFGRKQRWRAYEKPRPTGAALCLDDGVRQQIGPLDKDVELLKLPLGQRELLVELTALRGVVHRFRRRALVRRRAQRIEEGAESIRL
jgi:hypothetical protein